MLLFSGVREQVKRLLAERDKVAGKFKLQLPQTPDLPVMRMLTLRGRPNAGDSTAIFSVENSDF